MSIDETFEKWKNKYVREDEDLDFDLIILEDMSAAWNASRIEVLSQMRDKILAREKITKTPAMFPYKFFLLFIDTELEKLEKK